MGGFGNRLGFAVIPARLAWACAAIAMALELTVTWGIPALVPGHSLANDYISTAGATNSPYPGWFAIAGIVAAALHVVFVVHLWQSGNSRINRIASGMFGGFFVFLGIGLLFQCDPGCALETTEAWIHYWFGVFAFVCLGFAGIVTFIMAWSAKTYRSETVLAGSIALIIFDVALLISDQTQFLRGATERMVIITMMVWSSLWLLWLKVPDGRRWKPV